MCNWASSFQSQTLEQKVSNPSASSVIIQMWVAVWPLTAALRGLLRLHVPHMVVYEYNGLCPEIL